MNKSIITNSEKLYKISNKSVCLIHLDNDEVGSGFFIELVIPSSSSKLRGLITNNHVIHSSYLNSKSEIIIEMENKKKSYKISINEENFIFTSKLLDVTFIQLTKSEIEQIKPYFLKPIVGKYKKNETIHIIQYPLGQSLSVATGFIEKKYGIDCIHSISTQSGSSGAPLINSNFNVVGIHKGYRPTNNRNVGTNIEIVIYAIRTLYYRNSINNIKKTNFKVKQLSEEEVNELERYGLEKTVLKNVYIKSQPRSLPILILYRTNHGWYWTSVDRIKDDTLLSISISDNNYSTQNYGNIHIMDFLQKNNNNFSSDELLTLLKYYNWNIIPYKKLEIKNEYNIKQMTPNGHQILIMWLKLTGLMYI